MHRFGAKKAREVAVSINTKYHDFCQARLPGYLFTPKRSLDIITTKNKKSERWEIKKTFRAGLFSVRGNDAMTPNLAPQRRHQGIRGYPIRWKRYKRPHDSCGRLNFAKKWFERGFTRRYRWSLQRAPTSRQKITTQSTPS